MPARNAACACVDAASDIASDRDRAEPAESTDRSRGRRPRGGGAAGARLSSRRRGKIVGMEIADALAAVRRNHQAVLVTVKRDGKPQLSNVLAGVGDDDVIRVSITTSRAKYANRRRTPWAAVHVDGDSFWSY